MNRNEAAELRGRAGEGAVCALLEERGCQTVRRNYRIKGGEIDIIALDGEFIVFVEVKTRKFNAFDDGTAAMSKAKMKRIIAASERFVSDNPRYKDLYRRFDTAYVTVTTDRFPQVLDIEYYKADFTGMNL
ncbi:MAG: YraN family protein [Bacteroides sp.]|nr:YraN family protein [Bacteroides sp.]